MELNNIVQSLKWRYATKKYDSSRIVAQKDIDYIKEAVRLTASSYGLQLYKILDIQDPALRTQMQTLSWNQSQITAASHLFVFCNYLEVKPSNVDEMMLLKTKAYGVEEGSLSKYGDFIKSKLTQYDKDERLHWTAKQTYLALANAMLACAERRIDSTPMEGFERDEINSLLGLADKGLNAAVMLCIGYRHAEDKAQHAPKVRKPLSDLFETI